MKANNVCYGLFLVVYGTHQQILAQSVPSCATSCIVLPASCNTADPSCICHDTAWIASTCSCVIAQCDAAGVQQTINYAQSICSPVGVNFACPSASTSSTTSTSSSTKSTSSTSTTISTSSSSIRTTTSTTSSSTDTSSSSVPSSGQSSGETQSSPVHKGLSTGALVGISVGCTIAGIALLAVLAFWCRRHLRVSWTAHRKEKVSPNPTNETWNGGKAELSDIREEPGFDKSKAINEKRPPQYFASQSTPNPHAGTAPEYLANHEMSSANTRTEMPNAYTGVAPQHFVGQGMATAHTGTEMNTNANRHEMPSHLSANLSQPWSSDAGPYELDWQARGYRP